jgi:serine phosphatase RsbU (regulator of sigma subunit)
VLPLRLQPGDQILLYTDGVIEARDSAGNFYPLAERLPRQLQDDPVRRYGGSTATSCVT